MQDTWIDKAEHEIRDDIVAIAKKNTGLTNFKSTGVLRGFIEVIASVVFFIYKTAINPIYTNATVDKATLCAKAIIKQAGILQANRMAQE